MNGYRPTVETCSLPPTGGSIFHELRPIELTREEKIKSMISTCLRNDIEIPEQWVEEYNEMVNPVEREGRNEGRRKNL